MFNYYILCDIYTSIKPDVTPLASHGAGDHPCPRPASPLASQHVRLQVRLAGSGDGHPSERIAASCAAVKIGRGLTIAARRAAMKARIHRSRPAQAAKRETRNALYPHGRGGMTGGTYPMSLLDLLYLQALPRRLRLRPRADPLRRAPPRPPTLCRHLLRHRPSIAGLSLPHLFCDRKSLGTPFRRCAVPYCTSPPRIDSPESQLRCPHSLRKNAQPSHVVRRTPFKQTMPMPPKTLTYASPPHTPNPCRTSASH